MNAPVMQQLLSGATARASRAVRRRLARASISRLITGAAVAACLAAAVYWGLIASDRYVSEAHVVIQRTDPPGSQAMDLASLLSGGAGSSRSDQLLLRDYLLSPDMLRKLDARLNLRAHYASRERDPLSRMWAQDVPQEWFYRYYLSRVSVEFDDYGGVLVIRAQAYDAGTAHAIASMLVKEGEQVMNELAHRLAREQLEFVEKQVAEMAGRFQQARAAVTAYQNRKGLVSPQGEADSLAGVVGRLEAQRAELQAKRSALLGYLAPGAPGVVELDLQLGAIEKQIAREKAELAAPGGKALNSTVEEFQRLEMAALFAQDAYKTALVALEKGRVEAIRTLKKISVVQTPTLPEYPLEPRRVYNIVVSMLATLVVAGMAQLLVAIIRDHRE
jgi:capsular polysaccharide transport system permease protein